MFIEVATSCFQSLKNINLDKKIHTEFPRHKLLDNSCYQHKGTAQELLRKNLDEVNEFEAVYNSVLCNNTMFMMREQLSKSFLDETVWAHILGDYISKIKEKGSDTLARSLKPLFIIRTVTFWNKAEYNSVVYSEETLSKQSQILINYLRGVNV